MQSFVIATQLFVIATQSIVNATQSFVIATQSIMNAIQSLVNAFSSIAINTYDYEELFYDLKANIIEFKASGSHNEAIAKGSIVPALASRPREIIRIVPAVRT